MKLHKRSAIAICVGILTILTLGFYVPIVEAISKNVVSKIVYSNTPMKSIEEFSYSERGKPYTIVTGKDEKGSQIKVWLFSRNIFEAEICYILYEKDGISEEHAYQILTENNIYPFTPISLRFIEENTVPVDRQQKSYLPLGLYWWVECSNGEAFIDVRNGGFSKVDL